MQRTIRVQLPPSHTQAESLAETRRLFTLAFNRFVQFAWEAGISNATKLHYLAYYSVRAELPDLNAFRNIAATYQASVAKRDAGGLPISQPIVSNHESLTHD